MELELRFCDIEFRTNNKNNTMSVSGYVNKTEQYSQLLFDKESNRKFIEKIDKGAFRNAINNADWDIDFLAEHDEDLILSSTRNKSLILKEDDEGLYMEANITPTTWGKDYYELIQSKILRNMSFGFQTIEDSWTYNHQDNYYERTINKLSLIEVSVVRNPAYIQSSIESRGINSVKNIRIPIDLIKENREMKEIENKEANDAEINNKVEEKRNEQTEDNEELNENKEKKTQNEEEVEKRAYIYGFYDSKDVANSCLEIIGKSTSIVNFLAKNNDSRAQEFSNIVTTCLNYISRYNDNLISSNIISSTSTVEVNSIDKNEKKEERIEKNNDEIFKEINDLKELVEKLK